MLIAELEVATLSFSTRSPTTGEAQDADSLPTGVIYEGASGTPVAGASVVITNVGTGQYVASIDSAAGTWNPGETYHVRVTATVEGVTDTTQIGSWQMSNFNHGKAVRNYVDAISSGGISSASFSPNAITNIAIATDAIDADALADSAVDEIWNKSHATYSGGVDAFRVLCMAAAGAGAGELSIAGVAPDTPREETVSWLDGLTEAFTVSVDINGIRQSITML